MHASLNDFFICLLAAVLTLMSCLFFLHSEGGHDVITVWYKVRNCISFCIYIFFGMGFFPPLLHPWFDFHG